MAIIKSQTFPSRKSVLKSVLRVKLTNKLKERISKNIEVAVRDSGGGLNREKESAETIWPVFCGP